MELLGTNLEYLNCAVLETLYCFMILNSHFTTMPPKRNRRNNNSRATPYDMSNINTVFDLCSALCAKLFQNGGKFF